MARPLKNDILHTLAAHVPAMRALGVRRIGLFGSAVRGQLGPGSDLDFVVDLSPKTFDAYMDE
jgi:predicted nucleotidyltransferase